MAKDTARLSIIREGARQVHSKGYNNTGLSDILQAAAIPKGSFYFYFKSKVDFGLAIIDRYLDCGDLHHGFPRVKRRDCHHEYLLAFSCKRRHFCPSCHQKRVAEFGELLCSYVVRKVLHPYFLLSVSKI